MEAELRPGDRVVGTHPSGFGIEIEAADVDGAVIYRAFVTGPGIRQMLGPFPSVRMARTEAREEAWNRMKQARIQMGVMIRRFAWRVVRT